MRTDVLSLTFLALLSSVSARPRPAREIHARNAIRPRVTMIDARAAAPTTAPEVLVYRDDSHYESLRTTTEVVAIIPPRSVAPASTALVFDLVKPAKKPRAEGSGGGSTGVTYAPFKGEGQCKTADEIKKDLEALKGKYSMVRLYAPDCGQVPVAIEVAASAGLKLFLGVFSVDKAEEEAKKLVDEVGGKWENVITVSVGNEVVNNGGSVDSVKGAMAKAKDVLKKGGFEGPVVTCDTWVATRDNPSLCDDLEYCAMNMHPFFDPNATPDTAGDFMTDQIANVKAKLKDKNQRIVITETGWPWKGDGKPNISKEAQKTAIEKIKAAFSSNPEDVFLFTAYNDPWKPDNPATFNAEKYWGVDAADAPSAS